MERDKIMISVAALEKSYQDLPVLKGVDFQVEKGSIFALLGSNGAGKTTIVKILSTLVKPDKGSASINGYDICRQEKGVRESISLTGQYAAVDESLTARENLLMIASLLHLSDIKKRAEKLLETFRLTDAADRRVSGYSGGMRRRLDIAMSLIGNPQVIFLDEPTTGLDPQSRISLWEIVKQLSSSGITIFLTTQYLEEAEYLADHAAILHHGKIIADGSLLSLKKNLPNSTMEFVFHNPEDLGKAYALLKAYQVSKNEEMLKMQITTDNSLNQTADILNKLNQASITVSGFSQKMPSLEEVFLTLIHEKENV